MSIPALKSQFKHTCVVYIRSRKSILIVRRSISEVQSMLWSSLTRTRRTRSDFQPPKPIPSEHDLPGHSRPESWKNLRIPSRTYAGRPSVPRVSIQVHDRRRNRAKFRSGRCNWFGQINWISNNMLTKRIWTHSADHSIST